MERAFHEVTDSIIQTLRGVFIFTVFAFWKWEKPTALKNKEAPAQLMGSPRTKSLHKEAHRAQGSPCVYKEKPIAQKMTEAPAQIWKVPTAHDILSL